MIAIHPFSESFSERWITYCEEKKISYKIVDCFANDILDQMEDCSILIWHWHHADPKAVLFARQLTYSLEMMGKTVFPNSKTVWHFDDKVGQKYLLEAVKAPIVPTYVFYDKNAAMEWSETASFPKVFKLRGGAGSYNVKLAKTKIDAQKFIKRAFGKGFSSVPGYTRDFKTKVQRIASIKELLRKLLRAPRIILTVMNSNKVMGKERGYVYFQDFIPNNLFDIRIVVIGKEAFGLKREVRKNDFRASGSGKIIYDKKQINEECIKIAFKTSRKLQSQSMAYDFVFDSSGIPQIVEISYGVSYKAYDKCDGVWDENLNWHKKNVDVPVMILESLIHSS